MAKDISVTKQEPEAVKMDKLVQKIIAAERRKTEAAMKGREEVESLRKAGVTSSQRRESRQLERKTETELERIAYEGKQEERELRKTATAPPSPELVSANADLTDLSVARYFDLNVSDYSKWEGKLGIIRGWAEQQSNSRDKLDILESIRKLERKLGTPPLGDRRINHLYKWIRLDLDRMRIRKEQSFYERTLK